MSRSGPRAPESLDGIGSSVWRAATSGVMFTDRLAADQLADPLIVGRRPGPFGEPMGKRAAWGSVSEYRFRDGVVFESAFVGDTLSLLKQLGFTSIHPRLEPAWKRDGW